MGLCGRVCAVVELGSFTRAAAALGFTQSAVSQQVAVLERQLGARLLVRRPLTTTAAGDAFLRHARELIARADAARADVQRLGGPPDAMTAPRVALTPGAEPLVARRLPASVDSMRVLDARAAATGLQDGSVDVAVIDGVTAPSDPLPWERPVRADIGVVAEHGLRILVPASHPLAARARISLATVADARWIETPRYSYSATALGSAARVALRSRVVYDGNSMDTVCALVAAGAGLAAEPNADRRDPVRRAGVVSIPLTEPDLTHRIEIWWHRNAHPPVTEFAAAVLAASGLCGRVSTR